MDEIRNYSVYALYSKYGHLYFGISKNLKVRLHQHFQKSSNPSLRQLMSSPSIKMYSEILINNLTEQEAEEYEKYLISYYRCDGMSIVLNISAGGTGGSISGENHARAKISDKEVVEIRNLYANQKFSIQDLSEKYKVSITTIHNIISGKRSPHLGGPISENNLDRCKHYKITDYEVLKMREKYSKIAEKIVFKEEAKQYNISGQHFSRLLRGVASSHLPGPLLGKDYKNG